MIRRFSALAAISLIAGLLAAPSLAWADATKKDASIDTVRFSYEKWSRTGQKRFVLVPKSTQIKPGTMQDRVRVLFKSLVGKKRNTYGDARLAFKPDAAKSGVVFVYLDAKKAQYNPIVMAETVYTFTENGASKVVFPKVADQGWTRSDVPYPAYILTVPLWQALPPAGLSGALVQMPDGSLLPSMVATERLKKGDKTTIEAMWSSVKAGPQAASLAAIAAAIALKLPDLETRLLPILSLANKTLRNAALDGLAGRDNSTVNAALRKVMDGDAEPTLRDKAAGLLSASKDPAFSTAAQYHALRSKDAKIVAKAAAGLSTSKQPEAGKQLLAALSHKDDKVRAAVISSLLKRGDHASLTALLKDKKTALPVRIEVARALATGKQKSAKHTALMFMATEASGDDSAGAAAALPGFNKPATYAALGKALKHKEAATRRSAAAALDRLGDIKGLSLLAAADVEDAETGKALKTAIRGIYAKQDLDYVLKGARSRTPVLKRAAVATLGGIALTKKGKRYRKQIVETLQPLAKSKDPELRASAANSFEAMAGKDVTGDILALAADKALPVQQASAHALRAFPGKKSVSILLGFAKAKDPLLIANAIESLGLLKSQEALDSVVSQLNHKDARVRRAATGALVGIGSSLPDAKRKPMLSFFSERLFDKDPDVRLKAVDGLRLVNDPRTIMALSALLQDKVPNIRKATLLAMAASKDKSAVEAITTAFDDHDKSVRKTALDALRTLKQKSAIKPLTTYAKSEKDKALADEARSVIKSLK